MLVCDERSRVQLLSHQWFLERAEAYAPRLEELNSYPAPLIEWMGKLPVSLLGKRFEALVAFWLHDQQELQLLHHGVQLRTGDKTVGEADFILFNKETEENWHLEVACKYYFSPQGKRGWADWIGPNGRDSLAEKMAKFERQLHVFDSKEGRAFLNEHQLHIHRHVAMLKGYFFHHYTLLGRQRDALQAHPHYCGGWFAWENELNVFTTQPFQWLVLPKSRWISPYLHAEGEFELLNGEDMAHCLGDLLSTTKKAHMVVQVMPDENGLLRELSRGMVVPMRVR